jgi:plastocyanin
MSDEPRGSAVDQRPEPDAPPEDREERRTGLPPIGYPLLAVLFAGALVWSFSRVLLAVDKDQAVAIATLMALNILAGSALVAYGGRVRRRPAAFPALLFAGVGVIGVGLVANFAYGDHGPEKANEAAVKPQTVEVTAENTKFLQTKLSLTAGAQVTIDFDNKDPATHNIVIFRGTDATGPQIFRGDLVTGPKTAQYRFTAPPPGTYFFHCEVHPTTMNGPLNVKPAAKQAIPRTVAVGD